MKKSMKKILIALLAGLLCLSMLFSCGGDPTNTTDTTETTEDNSGAESPDRKIQLVTDGDSEYRIVIAKGAKKYEEDAAYLLRTMVLIMTGKALPVVTDDTAPTEYEIVVGSSTNRKQYYTTPVDYEGGYCVFTSGNRVIFESASSLGMERALVSFGKDNFKVNLT